MKNTLSNLLVILFTFLLISGCDDLFSKEEDGSCDDISCFNGGYCDEDTGNCICPDGWTGEFCDEAAGSGSIDGQNAGWFGEDNMDQVPSSTNFGFGNSNLPSAVDLTNYFPPIGNQNPYGTCVAWAVGYNVKTALSAIERQLNSSDLNEPSNQFSPKFLYNSIPSNEKSGCGGTNFSSALNILQQNGIATMQTVPYTDLGNCSPSSIQSNWQQEASQNRISYYRRIDPTVGAVKENLANNIPIIIGLKLPQNFMNWNSSSVMTSRTDWVLSGDQHAYHALAIAGYDDSKGPNGAFKVVNSWDYNWGDNGTIWIDYNLLLNELCVTFNGGKPLFIAANESGNGNGGEPDPNPTSTGGDLAPWVNQDYSTYQYSGYINSRQIDFNIYNIGSQPVNASSAWGFYYVYYNAYNANDWGFIFADEFNTSVPANTFQQTDYTTFTFNFNIPAGGDFTSAVWGYNSIVRDYFMPPINGEYYLLMIADARDDIAEQNEQNNLFYTTSQFPIFFQDGYGFAGDEEAGIRSEYEHSFENTISVNSTVLKKHEFMTSVKPSTQNAYTPEEIIDFLKQRKADGSFETKLSEAGPEVQQFNKYN